MLQYLYTKYGRDRAAITGVIISYRPKSAIRDVGKALGMSLETVDAIAKGHYWWDGREVKPERLKEVGLSVDALQVRQLLHLTEQLLGFPRHLSQHTGGFVLTKGPLCRMVPIENASMVDRTVIEWDKDDLDALGLLKGNSPLKAVVDSRAVYGAMSATCWSRPKPTRQARPSQ